jgi:hypothetical protein
MRKVVLTMLVAALAGMSAGPAGADLADRAARTARAYLTALGERDGKTACRLLASEGMRRECAGMTRYKHVWDGGVPLGSRWRARAQVQGAFVRLDVAGQSRETKATVRDVLWTRMRAPSRLLRPGRLLWLATGWNYADDPQQTSRPLTAADLGPAVDPLGSLPCQADGVATDDPAGDVVDPSRDVDPSALPPSPVRTSLDVRSVRASVLTVTSAAWWCSSAPLR